MARSRRATASSVDDEEGEDDIDISTSFQVDWRHDRNAEFSLLHTILSDLSFMVGREVDYSGLQSALRKQQERCGEMKEV